MTPKEKSNELIEKFLNKPINFPYIDTVDKQCIGSGYMTYKSAVKCAIIAVEEIIKELLKVEVMIHPDFQSIFVQKIEFWQEVKQQLENEL